MTKTDIRTFSYLSISCRYSNLKNKNNKFFPTHKKPKKFEPQKIREMRNQYTYQICTRLQNFGSFRSQFSEPDISHRFKGNFVVQKYVVFGCFDNKRKHNGQKKEVKKRCESSWQQVLHTHFTNGLNYKDIASLTEMSRSSQFVVACAHSAKTHLMWCVTRVFFIPHLIDYE